ncbi:MAG: hypothetical protein MI723_10725 [Caulobacterales bacterium]|nr:hypothetical protein [Caulobacterales bacterium]
MTSLARAGAFVGGCFLRPPSLGASPPPPPPPPPPPGDTILSLLFPSTEQGGLFSIADAVSAGGLWQDTGKTLAAGVGDPVRVVEDQSGNGNDLVFASDAARPILRQTGGLSYLEFDGVDDGGQLTVQPQTGVSLDYYWGVDIPVSELYGCFINHGGVGSSASPLVGVVHDGSGGSHYTEAGAPTTYVDGAALPAETRDAFRDAVCVGAPKVVTMAGVNLTPGAVFSAVSGYTSGSAWRLEMHLYVLAFGPSPSAGDRASIEGLVSDECGGVL